MISLKAFREGERAPAWSGPIYFDYLTFKFVYAPIGLHWLLRLGRWTYISILNLSHRPNFDDAAIDGALAAAERRGYNNGFRSGANEAQRWISGMLWGLVDKDK